jgi:hypothetical protein
LTRDALLSKLTGAGVATLSQVENVMTASWANLAHVGSKKSHSRAYLGRFGPAQPFFCFFLPQSQFFSFHWRFNQSI